MDPLKNNKYIAAGLLALLVALIATLIAEMLVEPKYLKKSVYTIIEDTGASGPVEVAGAQKTTIEPIDALLQEVSLEKGEALAKKKCKQCHTFEQDGKNMVGPNLFGIVNSDIGEGRNCFNFSKAMSTKGGKWTIDALNQYLAKPRDYVPGTKMSFAGLKKAKERAEVIKYLSSLK